ncbi:ribosomal L7Ae/L30e/S12e/Gadd45 family protein [Dehalobacter sp. DCM]|uniref:L7Ae/L30e/S12e/Gadd45 family ribosomal protein n=1 Tax=Dehalobacter sp. DCM TaxID=2907827 RepID=UPI0030812EDE|nr:ribosomal L7Ae/L30e/S12e/Gadd45 family protein [Dehalobacter sp. DCM]
MLDASIKKAQNVVVGIKQTIRSLEKGEVSWVYLAQDADAKMIRPIREMCAARQIEIKEVPTMSELGKACGIKVGAAVAAVLIS